MVKGCFLPDQSVYSFAPPGASYPSKFSLFLRLALRSLLTFSGFLDFPWVKGNFGLFFGPFGVLDSPHFDRVCQLLIIHQVDVFLTADELRS